MKIRRRDRKEDAIYKKAHRRLSRLDTPSVLDWCDQSGTALARTLRDYQKGVGSLEDPTMALICLEAALDILRVREG